MNIKPIGERVLLKPIKKEEKTKSGILLSSKSSNTDTKNEAEVVALGKGEKLEVLGGLEVKLTPSKSTYLYG